LIITVNQHSNALQSKGANLRQKMSLLAITKTLVKNMCLHHVDLPQVDGST